eukprot:CAMPEP_0174348538 /NCGR_PEP_ID=MMETSP0811_2-20130205/5060_1 /TAXON_ID=73025 ORGANISM="Eutreptiella gymnastica-like, Strain CCMP1594" /NCGR_SAMPLE_ID=MMETSP0811_2 /ASSEMBLY_ACC=CAM_ASM_000667 /LENGTH=57 /DNA_ID=CAMNT_0015475187 /DNA_START=121 /DNA_END=291 /DNA_ORIENTATION=+
MTRAKRNSKTQQHTAPALDVQTSKNAHSTPPVLQTPGLLVRKHQESQESDGQTGSWC